MTLMVQLRTLASTMLIPFSWLLGSWSDHYYDRYERALDKLTKRIAAHKVGGSLCCPCDRSPLGTTHTHTHTHKPTGPAAQATADAYPMDVGECTLCTWSPVHSFGTQAAGILCDMCGYTHQKPWASQQQQQKTTTSQSCDPHRLSPRGYIHGPHFYLEPLHLCCGFQVGMCCKGIQDGDNVALLARCNGIRNNLQSSSMISRCVCVCVCVCVCLH